MDDFNLFAAWFAILAGLLTGTAMGLFFHRPDWMGGYGSWRRRMVRLGHISFFGTGFLNLAFVLSVEHLHLARRRRSRPRGSCWAPCSCHSSVSSRHGASRSGGCSSSRWLP